MSTESDLLTSLAQYLNDQGVGVYKVDGYATDDTGIVFGELQSDPDRQIGLTVYDSAENYVLQPISEYRVQLWFRGAPGNTMDAANLASDTFDVLQGLQDVQWGNLRLIQCKRLVVSDQNQDANLRAERADSYVFHVNTPATARRS